jgi:hypothetical protein
MDTPFKYAEDTGDYPVETGDVWTLHSREHATPIAALACCDLNQPAALDRALNLIGEEPAAGFVDPPWNGGNARSFRTKAGLATEGPIDFPALINVVLRRLPNECAIEMGIAATPAVINQAESLGFTHVNTYETTYYRKNPCRLIVFGHRIIPDAFGADDAHLPGLVTRALVPQNGVLIDPMFGRGLAAVSAVGIGRRFVGSELNPRRVAITLQKLARLTGLTPTKEPA